MNDKNEREREYCENQLILIQNEKNVSIHAGKTFVYKDVDDSQEYDEAKGEYAGCIRSKCCVKKTRT